MDTNNDNIESTTSLDIEALNNSVDTNTLSKIKVKHNIEEEESIDFEALKKKKTSKSKNTKDVVYLIILGVLVIFVAVALFLLFKGA